MGKDAKLKMKMSLSVLQHLGINLYSNVPSVIAETIANAWDADAKNVQVVLGKDKITISDDGIGMTRNQVNDRFLLVGYERREKQPGPTALKREPMGRKGIGKLSLFSIANEIIVETVRKGEKTAMRMVYDDIKKKIKGNAEYFPKPYPVTGIDFRHGTRITLERLRKNLTKNTTKGLRARIARRFTVIGENNEFKVTVDGKEVTYGDRGYDGKLQYVWTYGSNPAYIPRKLEKAKVYVRKNKVRVTNGRDLTVKGWLATVHENKQLKDRFDDNLNKIAIYVRGKLAQEDILSDLAERGLNASYLIGELQVDALDTYSGGDSKLDDDAATSSRQRFVETDPRFVALRKFIIDELRNIKNKWTKNRVTSGTEEAMEIPSVRDWITGLKPDHRKIAKKWLGKIFKFNFQNPRVRKEMTKHAAIAFEFFRCREKLEVLDKISDQNIAELINIFKEIDGVEEALYGQIVRQRISVIRSLRKQTEVKAKEKAIQGFVFDHLWLLDPHWERVESTATKEKTIGKLFDVHQVCKLSEKEMRQRLDICYKEIAGKVVVIELKRPGESVSVYTISEQIHRYKNAIKKGLSKKGQIPQLEFICLLGQRPKEVIADQKDEEIVEKTLGAVNARYITYDQLLIRAEKRYSNYLEQTEKLNNLSKLIDALENN